RFVDVVAAAAQHDAGSPEHLSSVRRRGDLHGGWVVHDVDGDAGLAARPALVGGGGRYGPHAQGRERVLDLCAGAQIAVHVRVPGDGAAREGVLDVEDGGREGERHVRRDVPAAWREGYGGWHVA